MAQEIKMSAAGLKAMQDELEYLKTVRRKELAEEIKEARSHGDLSENSEYDEAKNTQGLVENRITELEQMVKNAVVIDESELSVDSVAVGTHVSIKMTGDDEVEEYDIVGRTEADPLNGKISDESPVGHALLEKAVGDTAEVLLPTGHTVNYKVLGMEPDEDGLQTIIAEVPLAELSNFTTFIRQTTQGRGWFTTEFARYEILPEMLVPAVVEQARKLGNLDEAADD